MQTEIKIISPEEFFTRKEEWWESYFNSFPANERLPEKEMLEFLTHKTTSCYTRVQIAESEGKIIGAQLSKIFTNLKIDFGFYIWVSAEYRKLSLGTSLQNNLKAIAKKNQLHFLCEVDLAQNLAWFKKIGLWEIPIEYHQPPIAKGMEWVKMRLMLDLELSPKAITPELLKQFLAESMFEIYQLKQSEIEQRLSSIAIPRSFPATNSSN